MKKRIYSKPFWKNAIGASSKSKRLKLIPNCEGCFACPIETCENENFKSKRGCRKHIFTKHGWYFYFDKKPNLDNVFPEICTRENKYKLPSRTKTTSMPMFLKSCEIGQKFKSWLQSPGGGGKQEPQSDQILCRVLKYLKYCCKDVDKSWNIPENVLDYCLGSLEMLSEFVEYLQTDWKMAHSGIIGYMNSIGHMLDYRRTFSEFIREKGATFVPTEIYLQRVKRHLSKKMKVCWRHVLSIDYLNSINCWASLQELQKVVPFHSDKYKQIVLNASTPTSVVSAHDLSFATSFIIAVLFLMVKASRPMTYQFLTVPMIKSVQENGIINQTIFKTNEKYGFDSLIFSKDVLRLINNYIDSLRPRLNPVCEYLLVCRNGTQLSKLSDILGRIVFQAIGKYINPTRYRQIIETESAEKLSASEQLNLNEDQKHTSNVARIHYQKLRSEEVALKAKSSLNKLCDGSQSSQEIANINFNVSAVSQSPIDNLNLNKTKKKNDCEDFEGTSKESETSKSDTGVTSRKRKVPFSKLEDDFIRKGIRKHGNGRWTAIINDPTFKFHSSRKASTLAVRARKL